MRDKKIYSRDSLKSILLMCLIWNYHCVYMCMCVWVSVCVCERVFVYVCICICMCVAVAYDFIVEKTFVLMNHAVAAPDLIKHQRRNSWRERGGRWKGRERVIVGIYLSNLQMETMSIWGGSIVWLGYRKIIVLRVHNILEHNQYDILNVWLSFKRQKQRFSFKKNIFFETCNVKNLSIHLS